MVAPARLELAHPRIPDFESGASTDSATGPLTWILPDSKLKKQAINEKKAHK